MFTTPGKFRVSAIQPSCGKYRSAHHGLSSAAVLGMWEEEEDTRIKPTATPSLSPSYTCHNMHREDNSYSQNVILLRHCKHGTLHDAISFFATMQKDLFSWNIMMSIQSPPRRRRRSPGTLQSNATRSNNPKQVHIC